MKISGTANLPILYNGNATISIKNGNTTIAKYKAHNNGGPALFSYLLLCLAGEYAMAEPARPLKIKLFDTGLAGMPPVLPEITPETSASNFLSMTSAPSLTENSLTLHFVVPFSFITKPAVDSICLYGVGESDVTRYSAFFYIVDDSGSIAPIEINKAMTNLSLILDWTLSFNNAKS